MKYRLQWSDYDWFPESLDLDSMAATELLYRLTQEHLPDTDIDVETFEPLPHRMELSVIEVVIDDEAVAKYEQERTAQ